MYLSALGAYVVILRAAPCSFKTESRSFGVNGPLRHRVHTRVPGMAPFWSCRAFKKCLLIEPANSYAWHGTHLFARLAPSPAYRL